MIAHVLPHPATFALAAAAVVGGAPMFAAGLKAWRLRRERARRPARSYEGHALDGDPVALAGRVALESPLFSPLTSRPCAGFRLEVRGPGAALTGDVAVTRAFSLVHDGGIAHVAGEHGTWRIGVTDQRVIEAHEPLSANLEALLGAKPEALWWRRAGGRLELIEHALFADATVHVVGQAVATRIVHDEAAWLATGTDDAPAYATPVESEEITIGPSPLEPLLISDLAPAPAPVEPWYHTLGLVAGPLLTLGGLWLLMHATDQLRSAGGLR
ncbi:MAG TPA: hypothetical protein VFK69_05760 [Candidatus Eisenbacteria bacterium]|nr:hypothetical protein [Candidatus Eisenbacteria bacterium]